MVNSMQPFPKHFKAEVIQILGGAGNSGAAYHAVQLVRQLPGLVHGSVHLLPVPEVTGSPELQRAFLEDAYVKEALLKKHLQDSPMFQLHWLASVPLIPRSCFH